MTKQNQYKKELAFLEALGLKERIGEQIEQTYQEMKKRYGDQLDIEKLRKQVNADDALIKIAEAITDFFSNEYLDQVIEELKDNENLDIPGGSVLIQIINRVLNDYYSGGSSKDFYIN